MSAWDEFETMNDTARSARFAQWLPVWAYWALLTLSAVLAILTVAPEGGERAPAFGAFSAFVAAVSAAGFVLHSRPRVLRKRWKDLHWSPDISLLSAAGLIDPAVTAGAVWVIRHSEHKKGRYPLIRLTSRDSSRRPWEEFGVQYYVSKDGDICVAIDLPRTWTDDETELTAIIT